MTPARLFRKKPERPAPAPFRAPRRTQELLPFTDLSRDGLLAFPGGHSVCLSFSDLNYRTLDDPERRERFCQWRSLLTSLPAGFRVKLSLFCAPGKNRVPHAAERGDGLDGFRADWERAARAAEQAGGGFLRTRYLTLIREGETEEDARAALSQLAASVSGALSAMGSTCRMLDGGERLALFASVCRREESSPVYPDRRPPETDLRDAVCPDWANRYDDCLRLGPRWARVLLLKDYPSCLDDGFFCGLLESPRLSLLTADVSPIPGQDAVRMVQNTLLGVETSIASWQRRQNRNQNYAAVVPYELEEERRATREFLDDLLARDQQMVRACITLLHCADSKEELDRDTERYRTAARSANCQLATLQFQQAEGFHTVLPAGPKPLPADRTLTTEALAAFCPFSVAENDDPDGFPAGVNAVSGRPVRVDRRKLQNGNSFLLGVSGSGKSFQAKAEIVHRVLAGDGDVLIVDPEREYGELTRALGGEVVELSAAAPNHINAMDLNRSYGDASDPVAAKSEFLLSLCESLTGNGGIGPAEKTLIDRCCKSVYRAYRRRSFAGNPPTLSDFRKELLSQPEPEAAELALALELFTDGSLNTFAQRTNVDLSRSLLCFDIHSLSAGLRSVGMLVLLDAIWNRISANRETGRQTFLFLDEIYLLFQHEYAANFLFALWKRVRKYGAYCTGITQNVEDLLRSPSASTMLSNSECVLMLNQAARDRAQLAGLLSVSQRQMRYVTDVPAGTGLLRFGSGMIPIRSVFPADTELYRLLNTKPAGREPAEHEKEENR